MSFTTVKTVLGLVAGLGAGAIADNAIRLMRPTNVRGFTKLATLIGGAMLTSCIGDRVCQHTEAILDTIKESWEKRNESENETETEEA